MALPFPQQAHLPDSASPHKQKGTKLKKTALLLLLVALGCPACKPAKIATGTPAPIPAASPAPSPLPGLRFIAYGGAPGKTDPKRMSFQVGWANRRQPSEFLSIRQFVPNTKFQVTSFRFKTRHNPRTNQEDDASELTLTNTETNQIFVLPRAIVTDSPPVF